MKVVRYKHALEYSYALGMTLVIEMLISKPKVVTRVFVNDQVVRDESFEKLLSLCKKEAVAVEQNNKIFNILSPKGNCYVIGLFQKFEQTLQNDSHIVLVNPSDAGNLGTIIRTIVGFNLNNLAIIRPAVDIFDPKVVRASMGALFHINFELFDSFDEYQKKYKTNHIYPFMLKANTYIQNSVFQKPFSLVFGNEATGLPDSMLTLDGAVPIRIPHSKNIDSLNLPLAVGIGAFIATIGKMQSK